MIGSAVAMFGRGTSSSITVAQGGSFLHYEFAGPRTYELHREPRSHSGTYWSMLPSDRATRPVMRRVDSGLWRRCNGAHEPLPVGADQRARGPGVRVLVLPIRPQLRDRPVCFTWCCIGIQLSLI